MRWITVFLHRLASSLCCMVKIKCEWNTGLTCATLCTPCCIEKKRCNAGCACCGGLRHITLFIPTWPLVIPTRPLVMSGCKSWGLGANILSERAPSCKPDRKSLAMPRKWPIMVSQTSAADSIFHVPRREIGIFFLFSHFWVPVWWLEWKL